MEFTNNQSVCINGLLAMAFIGFMMNNIFSKNKSKNEFVKKLTSSQESILNDITQERTRIFLYSFLLSVLFVIFFVPNRWTATFVCFTLTCALYELTPKSTYMVYHLETMDQMKQWKRYSVQMQMKHAFAVATAILAVPFICNVRNNVIE